MLRNATATYELIARAGLTHTRPPFAIDSVTVGNRDVEMHEEVAAQDAMAMSAQDKKAFFQTNAETVFGL